jgi:hypothetical protein
MAAQKNTIPLGPLGPWLPARSSIIVITPSQGAAILKEYNTKNRAFQSGVIDRVKHALVVGDWKCNGETIIFSSSGVLLDGQNRLKACVLADVPITTWVVFGADPDVFPTIDRGRNRGLGDDLSIRKEPNYSLAAATVRLVYEYANGNRSQMILSSIATSRELIEYLDANPIMRESIHFAAVSRKSIPIPTRISAALHYLFGLKHPELRDEFFSKFASGAEMESGHPILALRNRLFQERVGTQTSVRQGQAAHHSAFLVMFATIKVWNSLRRGDKVIKLALPTRDASGGFTAALPDIQ